MNNKTISNVSDVDENIQPIGVIDNEDLLSNCVISISDVLEEKIDALELSQMQLEARIKEEIGLLAEKVDETEKRLCETIETLNDTYVCAKRTEDKFQKLKEKMDLFLMKTEVMVPYEKGTYLRGCGAGKIVKLLDLWEKSE